jgi:hypothetical protein
VARAPSPATVAGETALELGTPLPRYIAIIELEEIRQVILGAQ